MSLSAVRNLIAVARQLIDDHGFRASSLVPDLALVGLAADAADAADSALDLLEGSRPYRAYAMARVCFEASQRVLPLAVAEDYLRLGTRAWVYYQCKDAALRGSPRFSLGSEAEEIVRFWENVNADARALIEEAVASLRSQSRGPDNYLGRNLAEVAAECYEVLASALGNVVPSDNIEINRRVYAGLSRDTHACLRLQPRALRAGAHGFVEVLETERDPMEVSEAVFLALSTSLRETIGGLQFRLAAREREEARGRLMGLQTAAASVRPDYYPDLGVQLAKEGLGHVECVFQGVPLVNVRELPDSTLTTSIVRVDAGQRQLVTFDLKGTSRAALLQLIQDRFPDLLAAAIPASVRLDLPAPIVVNIRAALGQIQRSADETFVPFLVREIEPGLTSG